MDYQLKELLDSTITLQLPANFDPYLELINWYRANNFDCLVTVREQFWFSQRVNVQLDNQALTLSFFHPNGIVWTNSNVSKVLDSGYILELLNMATNDDIEAYLTKLMFVANKDVKGGITKIDKMKVLNTDLELFSTVVFNKVGASNDLTSVVALAKDTNSKILAELGYRERKININLKRTYISKTNYKINSILLIPKNVFKYHCRYYEIHKLAKGKLEINIPINFDQEVANSIRTLLVDRKIDLPKDLINFVKVLDYLGIEF